MQRTLNPYQLGSTPRRSTKYVSDESGHSNLLSRESRRAMGVRYHATNYAPKALMAMQLPCKHQNRVRFLVGAPNKGCAQQTYNLSFG